MSPLCRLRTGVFILAASAVALACTDVTDVELVEIEAVGVVQGVVFLDDDGDGELSGNDTPQAGLPVVLNSAGGGELRRTTTDSVGFFRMEDVQAGSYALAVPAEALGDSLQVTGEEGESVVIQRGDTVTAELGISFPILAVGEIAGQPVGRRIFTSGITLNSRLPFGDGRVHVRGAGGALRALDVERLSLSTGDSVRLLGRTAVDGGGTVLEDVSAVVLIQQAAIPLPRDVTTGEASTADEGALDAELVRIRNASILDTATVGTDFRVTLDDGSGPVEMVLQPFLEFDRRTLVPDTVFAVASLEGLLVPSVQAGGAVRWSVYPRASSDLRVEVRQTDVALEMSQDFDVVSRNDTVTYTLVARNLGTRPASDVQVLDSLPVGLTLLEATSSRGTFRSSVGVWSLGPMAPGASDTLTLVTQVTTGVTGTFFHRARVRNVASEVDVNPGNNGVALALQIREPGEIRADLQLELETSRSAASPGDTLRLTATALNGGPLQVSAVQISLSLGSGLGLVEASTSAGSYDEGSGVWSLDRIPVAGSETLVLTVVLTPQASGTLRPRVTSLGTQREVDPEPNNDSASVSISVQSPS